MSRSGFGSEDTTPGRAENAEGAQLAVGATLGGRFRIERFLARGGMGEVYEAQDLELGETVALKLVRANALGSEGHELLKREVKLARRVSHPNVCRIHEYAAIDGQQVLTMELLRGETLAARLLRRPLSAVEARVLLEGLCAGLDAIHAVGVVHRDLKPANIFLCPVEGTGKPRVVITDFGVARGFEGGTQSNASGLVGTPRYMAPEQALGGKLTAAADVYALGVVLFEALTGQLPFEGDPVQQFFAKADTAPRRASSLVPGLDARWDALIAQCLVKEPAARPGSGSAMLAALERGVIAPVAAPKKKSRAWVAALVPVTALLVGGWVWSGRLPAEPRVKLEVVTPFTGAEAWLSDATQRLATRGFTNDRRVMPVSAAAADTVVKLEVKRGAQDLELRATARALPFGRERELARVTAPSVRELLEQAVPRVAEALRGTAFPPPTARELAIAKRLGTDDFENVRLLDAFVDCYWDVETADLVRCRPIVAAMLARAPRWPFARLAENSSLGSFSPTAHAATEQALAAIDRAQPGFVILDCFAKGSHDGECLEEAKRLIDDPEATYAELIYGQGLVSSMHPTLWQQYLRRLHAMRPDLQAGAQMVWDDHDLAQTAAVIARWEREAPEGVQRILATSQLRLREGKFDEARAVLDQGLLLLGDHPGYGLTMLDQLALVPALARAKEVAARLSVSGSDWAQAQALNRLGFIYVLEGRYRKAVETLDHGMARAAQFGLAGDLWTPAETLRGAAEQIGELPAAARAGNQTMALVEELGGYADPELWRYAQAALTEKCPDPAPYFERLRGKHDEVPGRRFLLRYRAMHGCGTCAEALAAGADFDAEFLDSSAYELGVCAEREGSTELALKAFTSLAEFRWAHSAHHIVLSKFARAKLLERLGRKDEALAGYTDFLRYWREADHPVPERAEAELAVKRLSAP